MSEAFDTPVWHNGKALRKGYTTGSCATAAAKVAALMVLRQHLIHQVSIVTPSGVTLCLNVESPHIEGQQAIAANIAFDTMDMELLIKLLHGEKLPSFFGSTTQRCCSLVVSC